MVFRLPPFSVMVRAMDSYETLDETRRSNYSIPPAVRLGMLSVAFGTAWFLLWKEISKKGLTSLVEAGTVILRRQTD